MKIFHLSDLHIGLKLFNRDLSEDQEAIFRQIADLAGREKPDVILVAGDIYDKAVPSAEAVSLFDRFISLLTDAAPEAEIMMISGNHDSAARINIFRSVLSRQHICFIDSRQCVCFIGRVRFYLCDLPSDPGHFCPPSGGFVIITAETA